ncbi:MAG: nucleotidyltransferase family protein [Clostridia bacterium]|nr:nucleotidyltransferase family protein [Clostridia bacterium]
MNIEQILFGLLRHALGVAPLNENQLKQIKEELSEEKAKRLFALAKKHDLAYSVCKALFDCNLINPEHKEYARFFKEFNLCLFRHENQKHQYERIKNFLIEQNIPFIPLKGVVIREYYPQQAQRSSCDIDVLVKEEQIESIVDAICENLGYTCDKKRGFHDYSLMAPGDVSLELHFSLKENRKNIDGLLEKVWEYAKPVGKTSEHYLTSEFLLFHIVAHASYHFLSGGCGVKPIMDIYILKERLDIDSDVFNSFLEQCSLTVFYNSLLKLAEVWLNGKEHDQLTQRMSDYILSGGVYGTRENSIAIHYAKNKTKRKYILSRIFLPYELLCTRYKVLRKHKWLYPFCQVARWFALLFNKKKLKNAKKEVQVSAQITEKKRQDTEALLKSIGL